MKKQGSLYLKIAFGVLGVTLILLILLQGVFPSSGGTKTEAAVIYEVGDGFSTSGFVVRSEQLVSKQGSLFVLSRNEGEWVGKGQNLATTYRDNASQEQQLKVAALNAELDRLQYAYDYCSATSDGAVLEKEIQSQLAQLSMGLAKKDTSAIAAASGHLKTYILRRYTDENDAAALWERINEIKNDLGGLHVSSDGSTTAFPAPVSGYFSANLDGYETVLTPELFTNCKLSDFERISSLSPSVSDSALCKLITSDIWYYMTVVDFASMDGYQPGNHLTVRFSYDIDKPLSMEITYMGPNENGKCVLVLKDDTYVFNTLQQRQQSAQIIFKSYTGLRVPKDALYFRNEKPGVYVLEGACAAWKSVEIIRDNGDTYLVALDKSDTDNLWPGDEIIITDEDIYPGKVVSP